MLPKPKKQHSNVTFDEMKNLGDKLPFSYYVENVSANELGLQLGSKFPEALESQETNKWIGPIPSGFGYHLVYINNKTESKLPDFDLIKNIILRDYEYDIQEETNELIYNELKKNYNIDFDIKSNDFDPKFVDILEQDLKN